MLLCCPYECAFWRLSWFPIEISTVTLEVSVALLHPHFARRLMCELQAFAIMSPSLSTTTVTCARVRCDACVVILTFRSLSVDEIALEAALVALEREVSGADCDVEIDS